VVEVFDKELIEFEIFGKEVSIGTPDKIESILIALYLVFFFIANQAQNKVIDLGIDYRVITIFKLNALAIDVWITFIILFHIALVGLFVMSLRSKDTHRIFDIIAGIFALFGVAILVGGVVNMIHSPTIHFFTTFRSIDFYHIGVYIEIVYAFYLTFTK